MKPAKAWPCDDSPAGANLLRRPRNWAILCKAVMSPIVMVVIDILLHNPVKMIAVKGNDVIKNVCANTSYPSFGLAVLPRGSIGGLLLLLGDDLYAAVQAAREAGFFTRCVTNGYWAATQDMAKKKLDRLVNSGLQEINLSSGENHGKYVPVQNILNACFAAVELGLKPLVTVEEFEGSALDIDVFFNNERFSKMQADGQITIQKNVWIENNGKSKISHKKEFSRLQEQKMNGCQILTSVIAITPDQQVWACCGLNATKIPELCLGNLKETTLPNALLQSKEDLIKMWLHLDGPEKMMMFLKELDVDGEGTDLGLSIPDAVHPCQSCIFMYSNNIIKRLVGRYRKEIESHVFPRYMSLMANKLVTATLQ